MLLSKLMAGHVPAEVGDRPRGGATEPMGPAEKPWHRALPDPESQWGVSPSDLAAHRDPLGGFETEIAIEPGSAP